LENLNTAVLNIKIFIVSIEKDDYSKQSGNANKRSTKICNSKKTWKVTSIYSKTLVGRISFPDYLIDVFGAIKEKMVRERRRLKKK
jgi:hypothetical protein